MKNLKKRIIVTLTSVLFVSSMMVSATAATSPYGTSTGNNVLLNVESQLIAKSLPYNFNENALFVDSADNSSATSNLAITKAVLSKSVAQTSNDSVKQKSTCSKSNTANACQNNSAAVCNTTGNTKCTTSTCPTTNKCVTSSCNSVGKLTAVPSNTSAISDNDTLVSWLNGLASKCGINTKNSFTAPATQTPQTSGGTNSVPTNDTSSTVPKDTGKEDSASFEQQVVTLVNQQRAANGLAPLTLNIQLSNAARAKSQDMHDNKYFSHTSPTYGSPFDMLKKFGISYRTAGENIAMGYASPEAVVNGWMNSPGHRANILNASFTQIGVGYVADGNYWTQEFIG